MSEILYFIIGCVVVPTIGYLLIFFLDWRFDKLKQHFPHYDICFKLIKKKGEIPKNHIYFKRKNDNEIPTEYNWFYATPHTDGWNRMKITSVEKNKLKEKVEIEKEVNLGCPVDIIENLEEKRKFQFPLGEVDIIWRVEYQSKYGWHCSVRRFEVNEKNYTEWLEKKLDYYSCKRQKTLKKIRKKYKEYYGEIIKIWIKTNKSIEDDEDG